MTSRIHNPLKLSPNFMILTFLSMFAGVVSAADGPTKTQSIKFRVTGLFSPDREGDLRLAINKLPGLELISLDRENAEAVFDPAKLFPGSKPEQNAENLDRLLKSVSSSTFGIKSSCSPPRDKLTTVEIRVLGLDCKGCCLAAYESIAEIDGVVQATVSFKEGRVTALIDPAKTDRGALETALKKRGVELASAHP